MSQSACEKFLNFLHHFHKPVHFGFGVVKIETGAGGGFHAEPVHERLGAVMAAAQRYARLVRQRHHIVGVNVLDQKAHQAGASGLRAE